jgi:hypothetical protein
MLQKTHIMVQVMKQLFCTSVPMFRSNFLPPSSSYTMECDALLPGRALITCCLCSCNKLSRLWNYVSQRQSYITTDSQSVRKSWCRAQSGTFDRELFFFFKVSVLSFGGALSDDRSGLSFVSLQSVYSSQSVFT